MTQIPVRRGSNVIAFALTAVAMVVAVSAFALHKSLPYRIGPNEYAGYLWAGRLSIASFVLLVPALVLSIALHRMLPAALAVIGMVFIFICMPNGVHSGPHPPTWCYNNLRKIVGAKEQCALKNGLTNGVTVTSEQISPYIEGGFGSLECAEHGSYTLDLIGIEPRCSVHGSMSELETGTAKR
jgi:hypothetical protein